MKIPQRNDRNQLGKWALELIQTCEASRPSRVSSGIMWRGYYMLGGSSNVPAAYNKIKTHVDRTASYLYSPVDIKWTIDYQSPKPIEFMNMATQAGAVLGKDFYRRGVNRKFGLGVKWGLVKGCNLLKLVQGPFGVDPWLVQPEMFAVLREDLTDLNAQEAFVHTTFLTQSLLETKLAGNPRKDELLKRIKAEARKRSEDPSRDDMFKQIIIGGIEPVALTAVNNPAGGIVRWMDGPTPQLPAEVMADLIRFDELWVQDDDKDDYTTIQLANERVVLEGDLQHQNLCGIKNHHPFIKICPNEQLNYFWGRSEIADLFLLQDAIQERFEGWARLAKLQANPPMLFTGMAIAEEKWTAQNLPGGFLSEEQPSAKGEPLAPPMPNNIWQDFTELNNMFADVAGTPPIMTGQGEQGVRAGTHAETLVRTASPRLRDRALDVENQLEDAGDLHLRFLEQHDPTPYPEKRQKQTFLQWLQGIADGKNGEFLLSQLPDDRIVEVDSHSASPAFSEDAMRLAFALDQRGAIGKPDLLRLTPVQHQDNLIAAAEAREEAQAKLVAEHPELLGKGAAKKR